MSQAPAVPFLAVATLLAGCTVQTFDRRDDTLLHNSRVQPRVVFLADNQRTLIQSEPIFEQSAFFHKSPASAHRGPAMENFSLDIVRHIVDRKGGDTDLVIHVGDMLNNSCVSEFADVIDSKKGVLRGRADRPVYVAPGNHDGFYLGITTPIKIKSKSSSLGLLNQLGGWAQVCTAAKDRKNCDDKRKDCLKFNEGKNLAGWSFSDWEQVEDNDPWPCEDSKHPLCETKVDWSGYAANILDKYSYVLAYVRNLGLDDYCRGEENSHADEACQPRKYIVEDTLQVRCVEPGEPANRSSLRYLREICWTQLDDGAGPEGYAWQAIDNDEMIPLRNDYRCKRGGKSCRYREEEPWRHFIVQHVVLPQGAKDAPVHFLIMDTTSYGPGTVFNEEGGLLDPEGYGAADNAQIREPQQRILMRWMDGVRKEDKKAQIVLVGHHPIKDFDKESRDFLGDLAEVPGVTHYISGDTHDGHDLRHAGLSNLREANLGATIDAPIEYALGGPLDDETGRFELARFSMTPGNVRRNGTKRLQRSYAESDGTYEACQAKGFAFDVILPAFAPWRRTDANEKFDDRLKRPWQFAGIPYAIAGIRPDQTMRNVRNSSILAYKINRLLKSLEVYASMYEDNAMDWPSGLVGLAKEIDGKGIQEPSQFNHPVNNQVEKIGAHLIWDPTNFSDPANYMTLHEQLTRAVAYFDDDVAPKRSGDALHWAKLCRALVEAHRYKFGRYVP